MPSRVVASTGDLSASLKAIGSKIPKAVTAQMAVEMRVVKQLAFDRAPVEYGNLEDAIKLERSNRGRLWTVYVDGSEPDHTGKYTVGDYAVWLHESIYELGPASLAKAARTGQPVGRKYLESALQDRINSGMLERLAKVTAEEAGVL